MLPPRPRYGVVACRGTVYGVDKGFGNLIVRVGMVFNGCIEADCCCESNIRGLYRVLQKISSISSVLKCVDKQ